MKASFGRVFFFNNKFLPVLAALFVVVAALAGCRPAEQAGGNNSSNQDLSIVCTVFPLYDWTRQIIGEQADNIELSLLMDDKVDLHNYQPTADDIVSITDCDIFIYVGGESDEWVDEVLAEAEQAGKTIRAVNLLEVLGDAAKTEELVEGMEPEEHEGETGEEHEGETADEHEGEAADEHIWLSLKTAQTLCAAITETLAEMDAENAESFQNNLTAYTEKLSALDATYQEAVLAAPVKTLLVGDRFPFRYLVDDYGLEYYAAFVGCSAETEASFETVIFLARKTDELDLKNIIVTESSDQSIAETIRDNTAGKDQRILVLDAMQSIARSDIDNGATYLAIMESNLSVLEEALA